MGNGCEEKMAVNTDNILDTEGTERDKLFVRGFEKNRDLLLFILFCL